MPHTRAYKEKSRGWLQGLQQRAHGRGLSGRHTQPSVGDAVWPLTGGQVACSCYRVSVQICVYACMQVCLDIGSCIYTYLTCMCAQYKLPHRCRRLWMVAPATRAQPRPRAPPVRVN